MSQNFIRTLGVWKLTTLLLFSISLRGQGLRVLPSACQASPPSSSISFPCPPPPQSTTNPLKVIADKGISCYLPRGISIAIRDLKHDYWWNCKLSDWQDCVELLQILSYRAKGKISIYCVLNMSQALCQRLHIMLFHLLTILIRKLGPREVNN